jgi:hypothetical protein
MAAPVPESMDTSSYAMKDEDSLQLFIKKKFLILAQTEHSVLCPSTNARTSVALS